jgi:hypothetical protein
LLIISVSEKPRKNLKTIKIFRFLAEKQGFLLQKMRLELVLRTAFSRLLTKAGLAPSDSSAGRTAQGFESL